MKTIEKMSLTAALLLFAVNFASAQQLFHVHEDIVPPNMNRQYNDVIATITLLAKENPIDNLPQIALEGNNGSYYWLRPILSMADLDKTSGVQLLAEKAGKEKVYGLFTELDKCYDTELDYIIRLDNSLSYMPTGMTQTPVGENYRSQHKLYVSPKNRALVKSKLEAIKKIMEDKGSKMYYRIYKSGFGTDEWYMVALAAKDAEDYAKKSKDNQALIGADGKKAFDELYASLLKYEIVTGTIRTDWMASQSK